MSVILNLGGTAQVSVSNVYRKLRCSSRKDEHPTFQTREGPRGGGEEQEHVFGRKGITGGNPPLSVSVHLPPLNYKSNDDDVTPSAPQAS